MKSTIQILALSICYSSLLCCDVKSPDCKNLLLTRLKNFDINLHEEFSIKFCNSDYAMGESSETIQAIISSNDYSSIEKLLNKKYYFQDFKAKEYAFNHVNYNSSMTGSSTITSKYKNNYYLKVLEKNSYTLLYLDEDSSLYVGYHNP